MRVKTIIKKYLSATISGLTNKNIKIGLGDLLLPKGNYTYMQFITCGRFLDIINYCDNADSSFRIKNTIGTVMRPDFDVKSGDAKFIKLIDSYNEFGYKEESKILIDSRFQIKNGTHRLAMHLYLGIPYINASVQQKKGSPYSVDSLFIGGVDSYVFNDIRLCNDQILLKLADLGQCFAILVKGEISSKQISLMNDINYLTHIVRIHESNGETRLFLVWINDPAYKIVGSHYYSRRAMEIESILRKRIEIGQMKTEVKVSKNCLEGHQMFLDFQNT